MFRLFILLILFSVLPAAAQFPSKPLRLIVGFPPGGAADVTIRIIAQGLAAKFCQPVTVEKRPGAESVIAAGVVGNAPPAGSILLLSPKTPMGAVPLLANPPPQPS